MTLNLPYKVRAGIYIVTGVLSPIVTYLFAKGIIGELEIILWGAEVSFAATVAALNTTPTKGEK